MRTFTINETYGAAYRGIVTLETDDAELLATIKALLTAPEAQQTPVELRRAKDHEDAMADVLAASAFAEYAGQFLARPAPAATKAAPERTYTLRDARVHAGWKTQNAAAYHLGISASYVCRLEATKIRFIPDRMLERLCSAYDITPAELRDPPAITAAEAIRAATNGAKEAREA